MRILIATDGSSYNRSAVEQFLETPFAAGTEVRIVAAYKRPSPMVTTEPMGVLREHDADPGSEAFKLAGDAAEYTAEMVRKKNADHKVMKAVLAGPAKTMILSEAKTFRADLIVIGASGHGAAERFVMGSVSQAVAEHAKCSVEIVRVQKKGNV